MFRELQITVRAETGGYKIDARVLDLDTNGTATGPPRVTSAVCSTYAQIPTRIKSLVDVAKEHMCPAKKDGGA